MDKPEGMNVYDQGFSLGRRCFMEVKPKDDRSVTHVVLSVADLAARDEAMFERGKEAAARVAKNGMMARFNWLWVNERIRAIPYKGEQ